MGRTDLVHGAVGGFLVGYFLSGLDKLNVDVGITLIF